MASNLLTMASNLLAMASNLLTMASNLLAMASNLLAMASNLLAKGKIGLSMSSNLARCNPGFLLRKVCLPSAVYPSLYWATMLKEHRHNLLRHRQEGASSSMVYTCDKGS